MSGITIMTPSDNELAREVLVSATPPNDSFTQLQLFSSEHIDRALNRGFRRSDWVWVATDEHGATLGVAAGWGAEHRATPWIIDFLDVSGAGDARDAVTVALLERAAADSVADDGAQVEVIHFLPTDTAGDDPQLVGRIAAIERAGFRLLVRRKRYRMAVAEATVKVPDTQLRFEPISGADDQRLVSILSEILVGSLDAHDVAALEQHGVDRVARDTASEYLEMDPVESVFLAFEPGGALAGLVIGGLRGGGSNGTASFVGVSHLHRGHGYAAQLLGWITARMIAAGAETIVGETDDGNFPMAKAFTAVGYPQTEARIDFQRAPAL